MEPDFGNGVLEQRQQDVDALRQADLPERDAGAYPHHEFVIERFPQQRHSERVGELGEHACRGLTHVRRAVSSQHPRNDVADFGGPDLRQRVQCPFADKRLQVTGRDVQPLDGGGTVEQPQPGGRVHPHLDGRILQGSRQNLGGGGFPQGPQRLGGPRPHFLVFLPQQLRDRAPTASRARTGTRGRSVTTNDGIGIPQQAHDILPHALVPHFGEGRRRIEAHAGIVVVQHLGDRLAMVDDSDLPDRLHDIRPQNRAGVPQQFEERRGGGGVGDPSENDGCIQTQSGVLVRQALHQRLHSRLTHAGEGVERPDPLLRVVQTGVQQRQHRLNRPQRSEGQSAGTSDIGAVIRQQLLVEGGDGLFRGELGQQLCGGFPDHHPVVRQGFQDHPRHSFIGKRDDFFEGGPPLIGELRLVQPLVSRIFENFLNWKYDIGLPAGPRSIAATGEAERGRPQQVPQRELATASALWPLPARFGSPRTD